MASPGKEVWRHVHCGHCGLDYIERVWQEQEVVGCPKCHWLGDIDRSRTAPTPPKEASRD